MADDMDTHSDEWQRQFVQYNMPRAPKELHDLNGDLITEDEVWMTDDGLVPLSCLVAYCKNKYDYLPNNVDEAIKMIGGHKYEHDIGFKR